MGHWAQKCPSWDKPKTACYKCQQLGKWATLCPLIQRDQGPEAATQMTAKTEEGPSSWPQYNRSTSPEWSQEHKCMWQVSQPFSYSVGGPPICLDFLLWTFLFIELHHHGSHRQTIQQAFYYIPLLCLGGIWILPQFFTNA